MLHRQKGYDGAANMSGKHQEGSSACPTAFSWGGIYVHCKSHCLNLANVHICKESEVVINQLTSERYDQTVWESLFDLAVSITDQFEILPTIPSRTGRQINRADNPSQYWQRSMYYPFLGYYITELTARLLENGRRYQAQYLIPINLPRLTPETVDVIFDTYKTDLRYDIVMFKAEIKRWKLKPFGQRIDNR